VFCQACAELKISLSDEQKLQGLCAQEKFFTDPTIQQILSLSPCLDFRSLLNSYILHAMNVPGEKKTYVAHITKYLKRIKWFYHCHESVYQTLDYLNENRYKLGVLTNKQGGNLLEEMELFGLRKYFSDDCLLTAEGLGVRKPHSAAFGEIIMRTGYLPSQIAYVGDNYWVDVVGAREVGIVPILIDRHQLYNASDCITIQHIKQVIELFR
jgi:putative hydrolase of the HAD superfamily